MSRIRFPHLKTEHFAVEKMQNANRIRTSSRRKSETNIKEKTVAQKTQKSSPKSTSHRSLNFYDKTHTYYLRVSSNSSSLTHMNTKTDLLVQPKHSIWRMQSNE